MTPTRWRQIEQIFSEALDRESAERASYIALAAGGDSVLENQVLELIEAHSSESAELDLGQNHLVHPTLAAGTALQPEDVVSGRYRIVRQIGAGGMGDVFEAFDLELGGSVALKFLRAGPESTSDGFLSRFRREIRLTRSLNHENICRVFDIGKHAGETGTTLFFSMELVRGESLDKWMRSDPRPAFPSIVFFLLQIIEGLKTAHDAGIVHCDLKPANIMLMSGNTPRAILMDFGIARLLPGQGLAPGTITRINAVVGTPAFMAPEQFSGGPITAATDVFALGRIMSDLLRGTHADKTELPEPWSSITSRCLQADPQARPALDEISGLLRCWKPADPPQARRRGMFLWRYVTVFSVVVATVAVVAVWRERGRMPVPPAESVALLPLSAEGANPEQQALTDGLTRALAEDLNSLPRRGHDLAIVGPGDLLVQKIHDVQGARRSFGVNTALIGSVRFGNGRVRVSLSSVDAVANRPLDSATFETVADDGMSAEDWLRRKTLQFLKVSDVPPRPPPDNVPPQAYLAYLTSRGHLNHPEIEADIEAAITGFRKTVAAVPDFARGWTGLCSAYRARYDLTHKSDSLPEAGESCDQAIRLNHRDPEAFAARGLLRNDRGDYRGAVEDFEQARILAPRSQDAERGLARAYEALGLPDRAERMWLSVIASQPNDWVPHNRLGAFYIRHGQFEPAVKQYRTVVALTPGNAPGFSNLGAALQGLGRLDDARQAFEKSLQITQSFNGLNNLANLLVRQERFSEAAGYYERALELSPGDAQVWANMAAAYSHLPGEQSKSADCYRKAAEFCRKSLETNPEDARTVSDLAAWTAFTGERAEPLRLIHRALALDSANVSVLMNAAETYEFLGFREDALLWTGKALEAGYPLSDIKGSPVLKNLVQDGRFPGIIRKATTSIVDRR